MILVNSDFRNVVADLFNHKTLLVNNLRRIQLQVVNEHKSQLKPLFELEHFVT